MRSSRFEGVYSPLRLLVVFLIALVVTLFVFALSSVTPKQAEPAYLATASPPSDFGAPSAPLRDYLTASLRGITGAHVAAGGSPGIMFIGAARDSLLGSAAGSQLHLQERHSHDGLARHYSNGVIAILSGAPERRNWRMRSFLTL